MKRLILILTPVIFYACSMQNATNKSTDYKCIGYKNEILTDSLLTIIPLIQTSSFKIVPESDDNIDEKLIKLNEKQIKFLYSTDELEKYYEFFGFSSYFYGKMTIRKGLLPILILNTDNSTAIYLDCFLINKNGEVKGMFNASYAEISDYSIHGNGFFLNDSTYNIIEKSYQPLDDFPNTYIKDSTIIKIRIEEARIIKDRIKVSSDTIKLNE